MMGALREGRAAGRLDSSLAPSGSRPLSLRPLLFHPGHVVGTCPWVSLLQLWIFNLVEGHHYRCVTHVDLRRETRASPAGGLGPSLAASRVTPQTLLEQQGRGRGSRQLGSWDQAGLPRGAGRGG